MKTFIFIFCLAPLLGQCFEDQRRVRERHWDSQVRTYKNHTRRFTNYNKKIIRQSSLDVSHLRAEYNRKLALYIEQKALETKKIKKQFFGVEKILLKENAPAITPQILSKYISLKQKIEIINLKFEQKKLNAYQDFKKAKLHVNRQTIKKGRTYAQEVNAWEYPFPSFSAEQKEEMSLAEKKHYSTQFRENYLTVFENFNKKLYRQASKELDFKFEMALEHEVLKRKEIIISEYINDLKFIEKEYLSSLAPSRSPASIKEKSFPTLRVALLETEQDMKSKVATFKLRLSNKFDKELFTKSMALDKEYDDKLAQFQKPFVKKLFQFEGYSK